MHGAAATPKSVNVVVGGGPVKRGNGEQPSPRGAAMDQVEDIVSVRGQQVVSKLSKGRLALQDLAIEGAHEFVVSAAPLAEFVPPNVIEHPASTALATRFREVSPTPVAVSAVFDDAHRVALMPTR